MIMDISRLRWLGPCYGRVVPRGAMGIFAVIVPATTLFWGFGRRRRARLNWT